MVHFRYLDDVTQLRVKVYECGAIFTALLQESQNAYIYIYTHRPRFLARRRRVDNFPILMYFRPRPGYIIYIYSEKPYLLEAV